MHPRDIIFYSFLLLVLLLQSCVFNDTPPDNTLEPLESSANEFVDTPCEEYLDDDAMLSYIFQNVCMHAEESELREQFSCKSRTSTNDFEDAFSDYCPYKKDSSDTETLFEQFTRSVDYIEGCYPGKWECDDFYHQREESECDGYWEMNSCRYGLDEWMDEEIEEEIWCEDTYTATKLDYVKFDIYCATKPNDHIYGHGSDKHCTFRDTVYSAWDYDCTQHPDTLERACEDADSIWVNGSNLLNGECFPDLERECEDAGNRWVKGILSLNGECIVPDDCFNLLTEEDMDTIRHDHICNNRAQLSITSFETNNDCTLQTKLDTTEWRFMEQCIEKGFSCLSDVTIGNVDIIDPEGSTLFNIHNDSIYVNDYKGHISIGIATVSYDKKTNGMTWQKIDSLDIPRRETYIFIDQVNPYTTYSIHSPNMYSISNDRVMLYLNFTADDSLRMVKSAPTIFINRQHCYDSTFSLELDTAFIYPFEAAPLILLRQ